MGLFSGLDPKLTVEQTGYFTGAEDKSFSEKHRMINNFFEETHRKHGYFYTMEYMKECWSGIKDYFSKTNLEIEHNYEK